MSDGSALKPFENMNDPTTSTQFSRQRKWGLLPFRSIGKIALCLRPGPDCHRERADWDVYHLVRPFRLSGLSRHFSVLER